MKFILDGRAFASMFSLQKTFRTEEVVSYKVEKECWSFTVNTVYFWFFFPPVQACLILLVNEKRNKATKKKNKIEKVFFFW